MGQFYVQASQVGRAPPFIPHPPHEKFDNGQQCPNMHEWLCRNPHSAGAGYLHKWMHVLKRLAQENRTGIKEFFDHFQ
jgi:hypothetical protein